MIMRRRGRPKAATAAEAFAAAKQSAAGDLVGRGQGVGVRTRIRWGYRAGVDSCVVQQQRKEQQDEPARSCMALALQAP